MRRLPPWVSVALVVGVALAALVTAIPPRGNEDSAEQVSRPSSANNPRGGAIEKKTFKRDGFSFSYPGAWVTGPDAATSVGGFTTAFAWDAATAASPSETDEVLLLMSEPLREPFLERDLGPYLKFRRDQLESAGREILEGPTRVVVAGLPTVRSVVELPNGTVRRRLEILGRQRVYLLTCRFVSAEMERGCDQVEESFRVG
jgi:hypothetical protein